MFFFDVRYLLFMAPVLLLTVFAQWRVQSTYKKYSQVRNGRNISGLETAQVLMQQEGLTNVRTEGIAGDLTDHYDPRDKTMRLSQGSQLSSVAAMAIVAHELGHAKQDQQGYFWLNLRGGIVGIANIGSNLGIWLVMGGLALSAFAGRSSGGFGLTLAWIGVVLMSGAVVFSLVTLPVEFDASSRAKEMLQRAGLVTPQEAQGVKAMLDAAALTYVAAAATAVVQLLYYVMLIAGRSERR